MSGNFQFFIKEIYSNFQINEKFKVTKLYTQFLLENYATLWNLQENSETHVYLFQIISYTILFEHLRYHKKNNLEADAIGVNISSNLLEHDINLPIRKLSENDADAIANLLYKMLYISDKSENDFLPFYKPWSLTITGIRTADLPKTRKIS